MFIFLSGKPDRFLFFVNIYLAIMLYNIPFCMRNLLSRVYHFLVNSNLLVSIAASSQVGLTYLLIGGSYNYLVILLVGCITLLMYNLSIFLSLPKEPLKSPYARTQWIGRNRLLFYLLSALAAVGSVVIFFKCMLDFRLLLFLSLTGVVGLLYVLPVFRVRGKWQGARQIPGLKVFHIAVVWTLLTVFLPMIEHLISGWVLPEALIYQIGARRFLFILLCTLPFDVRDMQSDEVYGLKTIPILLGQRKVRLIFYCGVVIHALVSLGFFPHGELVYAFWITDFILLIWVYKYVFRENSYIRSYLMDFILVVQFVLAWISTYFFSAGGFL